jgi:hypothetical protein
MEPQHRSMFYTMQPVYGTLFYKNGTRIHVLILHKFNNVMGPGSIQRGTFSIPMEPRYSVWFYTNGPRI